LKRKTNFVEDTINKANEMGWPKDGNQMKLYLEKYQQFIMQKKIPDRFHYSFLYVENSKNKREAYYHIAKHIVWTQK